VILGKTESMKRLHTAVKLLEAHRDQPQAEKPQNENAKPSKMPETQPVAKPSAKAETSHMPASPEHQGEAGRKPLTDIGELNRIAALAKLNVTDQAEAICKAIAPIMDLLDKLSETDLPKDSDDLNLELVNTFRPDIGRNQTQGERFAMRQKLLDQAPLVEAGCVSVPKVLSGEE